jgi:hypothetical protein
VKVLSFALANDPVAEQAAQDYLVGGGSAVGAVLSAFFAAAGAHAGVLLSPLSMLVHGVGAGARAFDGRPRQPGLGSKRPRGFKPSEGIPEAARVAVPTGVAALLVAHAYEGSQKLTTILKAGIQRAERGGAEGRAELLRRIRAVGAGALGEPSFVRAMLRVAGPSQGGLLTPSDFGSIPDLDHAAAERRVDSRVLLEPPWAGEVDKLELGSLGIGCAAIAVDVRGVFAALCYRRVSDGLVLEELELEAPLAAVPVQRGVTRVKPGARLPVPAPIAVLREPSGAPVEVMAAPAARRLGIADLEQASLALRRLGTEIVAVRR